MFNNITIENKKNTSKFSLIHPTIKLIIMILYMILIWLSDYIWLIVLSIFIILEIIFSQVSIKKYFKSILQIKWILLIVLLLSYNSPILIWQLILVTLNASLFLYTTSANQMNDGIEILLKPFNFKKITFMITIAIHFIPIILEQTNKVLKSQAARGVDYHKGTYKDKWIAVKASIIPVFSLTMIKSDHLAEALELKFYSLKTKQTKYKKYKINLFDCYLLFMHIGLIILFILRGVII